MNDVKVVFDGVWKSYRRGERAYSLRDALPALGRRFIGRQREGLADGEFYSLQDVSFQVRAGECLGIIGSNGAGKSTLLKCASRILRPNKGDVSVHGRVSALIEVGAGFHPDLTGRENVFLNASILGMRRKEVADRFDQIVEFSGLEEFIDTPVKRYSSGMYARLGFSVAAFLDPDVLLIDEVLSVGDLSFARRCEQKIKEILAGNTTVLFISHNLSAVRLICDRVLLLNRGRICYDGTADETIHAYHELLSRGEHARPSHEAIRSLTVVLRDETGDPTTTVAAGGTATLDMQATVAQPVLEAGLGFSIRSDDDQLVYACRMENVGADTVDLPAGGTIRARFRFTANLLPGTYTIGSAFLGRLENQGERTHLDRTANRVHLTVTGSKDAWGCANLFTDCIALEESKTCQSTESNGLRIDPRDGSAAPSSSAIVEAK